MRRNILKPRRLFPCDEVLAPETPFKTPVNNKSAPFDPKPTVPQNPYVLAKQCATLSMNLLLELQRLFERSTSVMTTIVLFWMDQFYTHDVERLVTFLQTLPKLDSSDSEYDAKAVLAMLIYPHDSVDALMKCVSMYIDFDNMFHKEMTNVNDNLSQEL